MTSLDHKIHAPRRDSGEQRTALLLHGFLGLGKDWRGLAEKLPAYRLIIPDLPGHGGSVGLLPGAYTTRGATEALLEVLDTTRTEKCHVVGYSMGGRLALYLGLKHPERVSSLLLESSSPGLKTDSERAARRESDGMLARRLETADGEDFRAFLEGWHRQPLFASLADHEGLVERLVSDRLNNDPKELAKSLRGMGTGSQPSLWKELPDLRVPTLAVAGKYDGKFVGIAREMSDLSRNIKSVTVAEAGHNVHTERPEEFAGLLASRLR